MEIGTLKRDGETVLKPEEWPLPAKAPAEEPLPAVREGEEVEVPA
jgi:hypothetical protein